MQYKNLYNLSALYITVTSILRSNILPCLCIFPLGFVSYSSSWCQKNGPDTADVKSIFVVLEVGFVDVPEGKKRREKRNCTPREYLSGAVLDNTNQYFMLRTCTHSKCVDGWMHVWIPLEQKNKRNLENLKTFKGSDFVNFLLGASNSLLSNFVGHFKT